MSRISSDIRPGFVFGGETAVSWIEQNTQGSICDLECPQFLNAFSLAISVDSSDWLIGGRWVRAFSANDLYKHVRTEQQLKSALLRGLSLLYECQIPSFEEVVRVVSRDLDIQSWVDSQIGLFTSLQAEDLLNNWFVLNTSRSIPEYAEYELAPIEGEECAISLARLLNRAVDHGTSDEDGPSHVFYAVRMRDLPVTVLADDYQDSILRWFADRLLLPPAYTLNDIVEATYQSGELPGTWASLLRDKSF